MVLEIAGGIVLAVLILAALPKLIDLSIYAAVAVLAVTGLLFLYWMWNILPAEAWALLALIFSAALIYGRSKNKAALNETARVEMEQKATKDAEFKVFLAESLERRKQRERNKNAA